MEFLNIKAILDAAVLNLPKNLDPASITIDNLLNQSCLSYFQLLIRKYHLKGTKELICSLENFEMFYPYPSIPSILNILLLKQNQTIIPDIIMKFPNKSLRDNIIIGTTNLSLINTGKIFFDTFFNFKFELSHFAGAICQSKELLALVSKLVEIEEEEEETQSEVHKFLKELSKDNLQTMVNTAISLTGEELCFKPIAEKMIEYFLDNVNNFGTLLAQNKITPNEDQVVNSANHHKFSLSIAMSNYGLKQIKPETAAKFFLEKCDIELVPIIFESNSDTSFDFVKEIAICINGGNDYNLVKVFYKIFQNKNYCLTDEGEISNGTKLFKLSPIFLKAAKESLAQINSYNDKQKKYFKPNQSKNKNKVILKSETQQERNKLMSEFGHKATYVPRTHSETRDGTGWPYSTIHHF